MNTGGREKKRKKEQREKERDRESAKKKKERRREKKSERVNALNPITATREQRKRMASPPPEFAADRDRNTTRKRINVIRNSDEGTDKRARDQIQRQSVPFS